MDNWNLNSFSDDGAIGGGTQENGDNYTMADFKSIISKLEREIQKRDLRLAEQEQEIIDLKKQLGDVKQTSLQGRSPLMVPTTVTTSTTWTGSMFTQPQVTFSSTMFRPVVSQQTEVKIPYSVPLGVEPFLWRKGSMSDTAPDLIQLDDSSESGTESSNLSISSEVGNGNRNDLESVVRMLGRHSCPKPEVYSLESGRSFSRFLQSFEAYCEGKYSSTHKDLWTSELGRFLEGEIKQVYEAWGGPEQKYRKMKSHLANWHEEAKERITSSRRSQYRNAKMLPGEGLKIFSTRLANLYRLAYPHRGLDGKDLKRQLLSTIPSVAAEILERDLALVRATTGRQNTWGDVLRLLEIQDESSRRGVASHQTPLRNSAHSWTGVVGRNLAMKVETVHQSKRDSQRLSTLPQIGSRSPGRIRCHWCKRPGHEYKYCRRRLNQCLRCGSESHKVSDCSKPPSSKWRKRGGSGFSSSTSRSETESQKSRSPGSQKAGKKRDQNRTSRKNTSSDSSCEGKPLNSDTLV